MRTTVASIDRELRRTVEMIRNARQRRDWDLVDLLKCDLNELLDERNDIAHREEVDA